MSSVFLFLLSLLVGIIYMNVLTPLHVWSTCNVHIITSHLPAFFGYVEVFLNLFQSCQWIYTHTLAHTFWEHGYLGFLTYCASLIRPSQEVNKMSWR